jgi:hypothetical protein
MFIGRRKKYKNQQNKKKATIKAIKIFWVGFCVAKDFFNVFLLLLAASSMFQ